ncbi:MAG: sodium:solute symporter [Bacteroidales bacterium]|nr:sodium:solute symporter [Bacteroidales bacterium]
MKFLSGADYVIIVAYFLVLISIGLILRKKASNSIEDYFIGGRKMPWWALGMSGMASWLDISGTLLIVSFVYLLGPRGMFIEFRGGVGLVLVVMMLWAGKYHNRSGVMTGSDWMIFRFGDGPGGRFAELAKVAAALVGLIGELAYLIFGAGLFFSMFLPLTPFYSALILIGVATLYTALSGFYGVVVSNIFQSLLIIVAIIYISVLAFGLIPDSESLQITAMEVTGNKNWISSIPHWKTHMPAGYDTFQYLMGFMFFYLLRNIFIGMGMGDDPRYFGARNERECGTLSLTWIVSMMFRWPMVMSLAILGIYLVKDLFPDPQVVSHAADLIKVYLPEVSKPEWTTVLSNIINKPQLFPAELVTSLKDILGPDNWTSKLNLVSFEGTVNPERIVPAVMLHKLGDGMKGLLTVALMAAGISTFNNNVNWAGSFFVRNVYQRYFRPKASNKEIIYTSWATTVVIVVIAFLFAFTIQSINDIWGWIAMAIGGAILAPTFLRLYWWRFNGGGFAIGMAVGLAAAVSQRIFFPEWNDIIKFLVVLGIGFIGTIIGTLITPPTERKVLEEFYSKTRPMGLWKPLKSILPPEVREKTEKENRNDLLAFPFALVFQVTLYLLPMQLIIKKYDTLFFLLGVLIIAITGLYFFWYRNLPAKKSVNKGLKTEYQA